MSKLPIFEHFLSVGNSQAKTQVVFQAKMFLLNWAPELRSSRVRVLCHLREHRRRRGLRQGNAARIGRGLHVSPEGSDALAGLQVKHSGRLLLPAQGQERPRLSPVGYSEKRTVVKVLTGQPFSKIVTGPKILTMVYGTTSNLAVFNHS